MSNGNYMCVLRSFFIVSFFYNKSPSLLQTTDSIAHMFLAEGVDGVSIASDRGSAPRKGMERFLQPMGEGRAGPRRSGQWEARVPKATTEPLRGGGVGLRDAPTHPPRRPVQSGGSSPQGRLRLSQMECSARPMRGGHLSPDNPSSNQEASERGRNRSDLARRVEWLSGPVYCSDRGRLLLVWRGGLVWVVVCGPLWWLLVAVVAEQPGSWTRRFRNVSSSPTVMVGDRCDRTRREGTRPGSVPP